MTCNRQMLTIRQRELTIFNIFNTKIIQGWSSCLTAQFSIISLFKMWVNSVLEYQQGRFFPKQTRKWCLRPEISTVLNHRCKCMWYPDHFVISLIFPTLMLCQYFSMWHFCVISWNVNIKQHHCNTDINTDDVVMISEDLCISCNFIPSDQPDVFLNTCHTSGKNNYS